MLKLKITKNKIIVILSMLLILISVFIKINDSFTNQKEKISDEKIVKEIINTDEVKTTTKQSNTPDTKVKNTNMSNYVAILEIPKIGLKKGLVMATKNFKSINYAISIDRHSQMPEHIGNFILYAHSGNSKISFFKNLKDLEINDDINVYFNSKNYSYKVIKKYEVKKNGHLSVYNDGVNKYITLTTCSQSDKSKQIVVIGKENQ